MRASCRNADAVVTASAADYHLRMPADPHAYRLVERAGPAGRVVLSRNAPGGTDLLVISGFRGPDPPAAIASPRLESCGPDTWRIASEQGALEFEARAVDVIETRPAVFAGLHRRFALGAVERLAVRALLTLLRLPGGERLLRRWHAGRGA